MVSDMNHALLCVGLSENRNCSTSVRSRSLSPMSIVRDVKSNKELISKIWDKSINSTPLLASDLQSYLQGERLIYVKITEDARELQICELVCCTWFPPFALWDYVGVLT